MRVAFVGSRTIEDQQLVERVIHESTFNITELVVNHVGTGFGLNAATWARANNIHIEEFDWAWDWQNKGGPTHREARRACLKEMALYVEAVIVVWGGQSTEVNDMCEEASALSLPICEGLYRIPKYGELKLEILKWCHDRPK